MFLRIARFYCLLLIGIHRVRGTIGDHPRIDSGSPARRVAVLSGEQASPTRPTSIPSTSRASIDSPTITEASTVVSDGTLVSSTASLLPHASSQNLPIATSSVLVAGQQVPVPCASRCGSVFGSIGACNLSPTSCQPLCTQAGYDDMLSCLDCLMTYSMSGFNEWAAEEMVGSVDVYCAQLGHAIVVTGDVTATPSTTASLTAFQTNSSKMPMSITQEQGTASTTDTSGTRRNYSSKWMTTVIIPGLILATGVLERL